MFIHSQVLNRSMDPKTYEPIQAPLINQLPPVQMPLLPQVLDIPIEIVTFNLVVAKPKTIIGTQIIPISACHHKWNGQELYSITRITV